VTLHEHFAKVMRMKRATRSAEVIEIAESLEVVMGGLSSPPPPTACAECAKRQAEDAKRRAGTKARVAAWRAREKAARESGQ
jgi:hypothetical protein